MEVTNAKFFRILLYAIFLALTECRNNQTQSSSSDVMQQRKPRLSLLHLMSPLTTADGCKTSTGVSGSCLSLQDCSKRGGKGVEGCAWGLGVCCVYSASCGGSSSANLTYFTSPGYPSPWRSQSGVCSFTLMRRRKFSPRVCQLRLDFEDFYITGTDPMSGQCTSDMFVISGQDLNNVVPVICGQNTGQHMYVNIQSSGTPVRITVTTSGESNERKWKIKVTQIACGSQHLAPPFCLQYFTGTVGNVKSFNYGNNNISQRAYPTHLNYAACLRKEAAMCGATFMPDGEFGVDRARGDMNCQNGDYLSIGTNRICGDTTVLGDRSIRHANNGPMILTFVSDDTHDRSDIGFSFRYTQFACSSA